MAHLRIGEHHHQQRSFTQADFDLFAALSGDDNPIHVNPDFAARSKFGATVAHGMLLYSAVDGALRAWLPGMQAASQSLMFPAPTYTGENVHIELACLDDSAEACLRIAVSVTRPGGEIALQGEALLCADGVTPPAPPEETSVPSEDPFYAQIHPGDRASITRRFASSDLITFASLANAPQPPVSVPGPLIGGLFSCLLGTRLPGPGSNYLKQRLHYHAAARPDEELRASVEVTRIRAAKHLINLATRCTAGDGRLICTGEALIMVSDVGKEA